MTRDEAIKLARRVWGNTSGDVVDTLVALGVLKVDLPPDDWSKFKTQMSCSGYNEASTAMRDIEEALRLADLKIVSR